MRDAAIRGRQGRDPLQIVLTAAEQLVGEAFVHAVAAEEQPLRFLALLGAAILMVDRLQVLDLRHHQRTIEPLDDPARKPDVIGMRVGDDQPRDVDVLQRSLEQRRPRCDGFLVAEAGIDHRPAITVGEQIDVHVIELERQLQAKPENTGPQFDDLIGTGRRFPGVAQGLGHALEGGFSGFHGRVLRFHSFGLAKQSAGRQPKNHGPDPHSQIWTLGRKWARR